MYFHPKLITIVFLVLFLIFYLFLLIRNTIKNKFDIYDVFILSMVGIIPVGFVLFPKQVMVITDILGVGFPFLWLFGVLFFIVFFYMYQLLIKIKEMENKLNRNIQDVALMRKKR